MLTRSIDTAAQVAIIREAAQLYAEHEIEVLRGRKPNASETQSALDALERIAVEALGLMTEEQWDAVVFMQGQEILDKYYRKQQTA